MVRWYKQPNLELSSAPLLKKIAILSGEDLKVATLPLFLKYVESVHTQMKIQGSAV